MYALAINGSPRKGGNTDILLHTVLKPLDAAGWETEFFQLGGKSIRGCMACGKCREKQNGKCIVDDDCFNKVMEKMLRADAIIIGSPTYFSSVSAETKALLDRGGYVGLGNGDALAGKIGAAVVAQRRGGATMVYDTILKMYQMSQMILPGSTYWNFGVGRDKGDVSGDAEGLKNMEHLGMAIDWLGRAKAAMDEPYPVMQRG